MVTFDFSGKTILITGASYGLGEAFALGFAKAGGELILTARSAELLDAVADACRKAGSPKVTVVAGDVSVEADVQRVVSTGLAEHGKIDALVNNAGISDMRGLAPVCEKNWRFTRGSDDAARILTVLAHGDNRHGCGTPGKM